MNNEVPLTEETFEELIESELDLIKHEAEAEAEAEAEVKINLIKDFSEKPKESQLGLIIKNTGENQRHTGFIFLKKENPVLTHFGWHNVIFYQEREGVDGYAMFWFDKDAIPERTLTNILTELAQFENNVPINSDKGVYSINAPYGIINKGGSQISKGKFIPNEEVKGDSLTCAVFVNCIFEQSDFPILDLESWVINEDDKEWQINILNKLESYLHPDFLMIQRENIGKFPRLRPEQMVGACCIFDLEPVHYSAANDAGLAVIEKLKILGC